MLNDKELIVISNEKVNLNSNGFFCDNLDIKTILEGLSKKFKILFCCKFSKEKRLVKFNIKETIAIKNLFDFIKCIYLIIKIKNKKILYISIHPFSFCFFLTLSLFRKNSFVYLRSDGFKEYEVILGKKWIWIYRIMFNITTFSSKIISCHSSLAKNKEQHLLNPSELDKEWFSSLKNPELNFPKLLYVGGLKIEKGIFSLIDIIKKIKSKNELTIIGSGEGVVANKSNSIKLVSFVNNKNDLINYYDNHNIVILPSFTEAHPKVVDEALARYRPVIIFSEIKHIIEGRSGVFVAERNSESLGKVILHIMKNYSNIQNTMKQNQLPTKENFLNELEKILKYQ